MDAKALVEKYIIIKVEQNGRVGVKPTNGKPTAREIEYLKTTARLLRQRGKAYVGAEIAAEAEWVCLMGRD